jgi:hypothetical protein
MTEQLWPDAVRLSTDPLFVRRKTVKLTLAIREVDGNYADDREISMACDWTRGLGQLILVLIQSIRGAGALQFYRGIELPSATAAI